MEKYMKIELFSATIYKKCGCCGRVRNLYYRLDIRDATTAQAIVGAIEMCDTCAENIGAITGQKLSKEREVAEFKFD